MSPQPHRLVLPSLVVYAMLWLPPVRHALQASMTAQMLLDIPLLIAIGGLLGAALPRTASAVLANWDRGGVSGLLLVSLTGLVWMLPRALDAAVETPWVTVAKLVSVPWLIGFPLAQSWPRAGFVLRGVFLLELIATCFRLGWLYLISPVRLCSNYLLDDQQRLGEYLLAIGAVIFLFVAGKLMWGSFGRPNSWNGAESDAG